MIDASCAVESCGRKVATRGWCVRHYERWRRHGDPCGGRAEHGEGVAWLRRQLAEADRGSCWLWPFGKAANGYGANVIIGSRTMRPHVAVMALAGRPIPSGKVARHLCPGGSKRLCCNPDHIAPGTSRQNVDDAMREGRVRSGESHAAARLTVAAVMEIRDALSAGEIQHRIAKRYGVADSVIAAIRLGRTWKHVGGAS